LNTGSRRDFITSGSNNFIQASAFVLSPAVIALQNIMYNAKSLVHLRFRASSSASSNNNLSLSCLSLFLLFVVVVLFSLLSEFNFLSHDPCRRLDIEFELLFIG
jgi:hypothetical protein